MCFLSSIKKDIQRTRAKELRAIGTSSLPLPQFLPRVTYQGENKHDLGHILNSETSFWETENQSRSWVRRLRSLLIHQKPLKKGLNQGTGIYSCSCTWLGRTLLILIHLEEKWTHRFKVLERYSKAERAIRCKKCRSDFTTAISLVSHLCSGFMHSFNRVAVRPLYFSIGSSKPHNCTSHCLITTRNWVG